MKTLLLLRHAKSSWKHKGLEDRDRPLNERGKRDAPRVGEVLRERDLVPQLIYASPAKRTLKSVEAAALAMDFDGDIAVDERLYLATPEELIEFVREFPEPAGTAMIVGHNPGLEEFVAAMTREIVPMPTAALAVIELAVNAWANASLDGGGTLTQAWRPKDDVKA